MANQFSAHSIQAAGQGNFIIATSLDLYVSWETGNDDDSFGDGLTEKSAWKTPQKALSWLADKVITDSGFVTINFAAGIYDIDSIIDVDHPNGNRIAFVGAEPETLLLQSVSNYRTSGYTAAGMSGFYSGVFHGITMNCVRYDSGTNYVPITAANQIRSSCTTPGCGVIVEDYDLVNKENYPVFAQYAVYPKNPRNNLTRQGAILGCHKLLSASTTSGQLEVESTIRDDWFVLPTITSPGDISRFYGNAILGQTYVNGSCANPSDTTENATNAWLIPQSNSERGQYISSVPVGYYGTNATTGITIGGTANLIGPSFPTAVTLTDSWLPIRDDNPVAYYGRLNGFVGVTGAIGNTMPYSATGPNGSMLNSQEFGANWYHEHAQVAGYEGSSANWRSVNSGRVVVTIIPTVFRRYGTILKVGNSGLRKIKNIFFDGELMPSFYELIGNGPQSSMQPLNGYSNKTAIQVSSSRAGYNIPAEPSGFSEGLCTNVGIKDFQVGILVKNASDANLGSVSISNCTYGILTNLGSSAKTIGSIATGCMHGFYAANNSSFETNRCFCSFSGQSLLELKIEDAGSSFGSDAFYHGQTFQNGGIMGTVYQWNPSTKTLKVALKMGLAEGRVVR